MVNETLCEKKYSIPDPGSHSRRLVNGRSQSPGRHGTTSPLVLSTHHQRPHPHPGPEDSVLPLTRLVSRAWYGIRHLTTPLRSIHLPVESPRKVGALESLLVTPQSWGDWSDTKHSKCLLLGGRRLNQLTLIPKPKGSGGARAATAQVGPANKRNDTKRCLPIEASLRPGEAVPW